MDGLAADLVISVEERLGEQVADVSAPEAVDDSSAVSLAGDEAGEAQLGEVLARHGRTATRHLRERSNVGIASS